VNCFIHFQEEKSTETLPVQPAKRQKTRSLPLDQSPTAVPSSAETSDPALHVVLSSAYHQPSAETNSNTNAGAITIFAPRKDLSIAPSSAGERSCKPIILFVCDEIKLF
jgi:hypothetical protein